ncbi:MAG: hypothetical protein AMXMBFR84_09730 [Candidatus Hydrogenedentota bacterium]
MNDLIPGSPMEAVWITVGVIGGALFYGRFYVQWWVSERRKQSVFPISFWYMSSVGSVLLLAFGVHSQSPLGTLSQSLNILIYSRNLVHIWRERGTLTAFRYWTIHLLVAVIAVISLAFLGAVWLGEWHRNAAAPASEAQTTWIWLAVGLLGQALFACRFLVQWIATERQRKSVIPESFWYLSIVASALMLGCFVQRGGKEWIFAVGMMANVLVYIRNLWFIHANPAAAQNQTNLT